MMNNSLAEKLHKWSLKELCLISESGVIRIPNIESLRTVTEGRNRKVWNYVVNHVRSESTVHNIKRTLYVKKLLKEKEEVLSFNDNSIDLANLQSAVIKATEKRTYLMSSISLIEERLQNLEQKIQHTKNETFRTNQKTGFLELLKQQLIEKNLSVRSLHSEISSHKTGLYACQSGKVSVTTLPYNVLNENDVIYDENISGIEDLLHLISVCKNSYNKDSSSLTISFLKNMNDEGLMKSGVLLTDIITSLNAMSDSDLQHFITKNLQSSSMKDFLGYGNKRDSEKVLLNNMKCANVNNSIAAIKNKNRTEKLLVTKKKIYEDKIKYAKSDPNNTNFELKCTLVEKLAEKEALIMSNNYLENYLKHTSNKTSTILANLCNKKKKSCDELSPLLQKFYSTADLTYFLIYTAANAFQKVFDDLNSLQSFARKEIFESPLPEKVCLEELKMCLISDRMQNWNYCHKKNLIKPMFTERSASDFALPSEVLKSLNLELFQNNSFMWENWTRFKQKLCAEAIAHSETYVKEDSVNVSEMYTKFLKMLELMKFSIEKGFLFTSEGMIFCHKTKSEIQEWWEQNAQYIAHIEYEEKTLKMWIDILTVLSEFEPRNYF